jgi:hypothetical protein
MTFLWAMVCSWFVAFHWTGEFAKDYLLARLIAVLLGLVVAILVSLWVVIAVARLSWNPIGNRNDLGLGAPPCDIDQLPPHKFGNDVIVAIRRSACPTGLFSNDEYTYFVFAMESGQSEDHGTLAFRYTTTDAGASSPPTVTQGPGSSVVVHVHEADVVGITKQRTQIGNVHIEYTIKVGHR